MNLGAFSPLPHELLLYGILHQLNPHELSNAASISSEFRDLVHTEDLWKDLCIGWFDGDFIFGSSWRETFICNFNINSSSNTDRNKTNGSFKSTCRKRKREQDLTSKFLQSIQSNIGADLTQFCGAESILFLGDAWEVVCQSLEISAVVIILIS